MTRKLAKPYLLLHHSIYTEYLNYKKMPVSHRIKGREEVRNIVKTICKHIGNEIVDRKAGVHINGLGYFFIWKIPKKMTYNKKIKGVGLEENFNYHTNNYMYSPILLPSLDKKDTLAYWSMDNSFVNKLKQGVKKNVMAGFKYKIYPYSIRRLNTL